MRRQSLAFVTAANKTSAIGILFDVDYDVIVKKPCFQQGSTLKILKNFRTLFFLILEQRHGVIISIKPIRKQSERPALLQCLLVFGLAVVPSHACLCLLVSVL